MKYKLYSWDCGRYYLIRRPVVSCLVFNSLVIDLLLNLPLCGMLFLVRLVPVLPFCIEA